MFVYILAFFDLVTAFVIWTHIYFGFFSPELVFIHALYIFVKGIAFAKWDFVSRIDAVLGFYAMLLSVQLLSVELLTLATIIWLFQKSMFTLAKPLFSMMK